MGKKVHWNHRVVKRKDANGETEWSLREVMYDGNRIESVTAEPIGVSTWSDLGGPATNKKALKELEWTLKAMLRALKHPIVNYDRLRVTK